MRPVRSITTKEENFRTVELVPGDLRFLASRRDPIEPEPIGTILIMAFRITGYSPDCDGSLMAEVANIDKNGKTTGWTEDRLGLYPNDALVATEEELKGLFEGD